MRFQSTRGGPSIPFKEAIYLGYPSDQGFYTPETVQEGAADLRSAIYAPLTGFPDVVALAAAELLPDVLDPRLIADIAFSAYGREPGLHPVDHDLLVLDMASGVTGSSVDYAASFEAGLLGRMFSPGNDLVVAAASHREAAALGAAFATSGSGLPIVILCPEGGAGTVPENSAGEHPSPVLIIEVKGGLKAAAALERSVAGSNFAGRHVVAGGAASLARLVGRSLLLIGLFSLARRGLSGDLVVAAPPGDLLGLVTGLWSWSWGLPVSAFLVPAFPDSANPAIDFPSSLHDGTAALEDPDRLAGAELLQSFGRDRPLGSLVLRMPLPAGTRASPSIDGLSLDEGSGLALEAARAALAAGLAGHGTIVVPRFAGPAPDRLSRPSRPLVDASPDALAAAVAGFLG